MMTEQYGEYLITYSEHDERFRAKKDDEEVASSRSLADLKKRLDRVGTVRRAAFKRFMVLGVNQGGNGRSVQGAHRNDREDRRRLEVGGQGFDSNQCRARSRMKQESPYTPLYPECEKLAAVSAESQKIGCFLDWLFENGMFIARYIKADGYRNEQAMPIDENIERLLARYFEIDLNKVENERRALIETLREAHEKR